MKKKAYHILILVTCFTVLFCRNADDINPKKQFNTTQLKFIENWKNDSLACWFRNAYDFNYLVDSFGILNNKNIDDIIEILGTPNKYIYSEEDKATIIIYYTIPSCLSSISDTGTNGIFFRQENGLEEPIEISIIE